jgi:hypothetical protein
MFAGSFSHIKSSEDNVFQDYFISSDNNIIPHEIFKGYYIQGVNNKIKNDLNLSCELKTAKKAI